MKKVINFESSKNRNAVLRAIQQLYPEDRYPKNIFPDLATVLMHHFLKQIKEHPNEQALYQDSDNPEPIESLAQERLSFRILLEQFPQTVVLMYRTCIKKFVQYKHPHNDEWEDLFQEVMTRLISDKIHRIREKFDFSYISDANNEEGIKKSSFTSYFMVTVRNIYMDIVRERNVRPLTRGGVLSLEDTDEIYEEKNMLNQLVIDEEFKKLRMLLMLYYRSQPRIELFLKLKCRLPLDHLEIQRCFPQCNDEDIHILTQDFKGIRDKKMFDTVVPIFNRNEGRENKSDTLRKWISIKVDEMVAHLNKTHPSNVYTGKNILDFFTLYFERIQNPGKESPLPEASFTQTLIQPEGTAGGNQWKQRI